MFRAPVMLQLDPVRHAEATILAPADVHRVGEMTVNLIPHQRFVSGWLKRRTRPRSDGRSRLLLGPTSHENTGDYERENGFLQDSDCLHSFDHRRDKACDVFATMLRDV